MVQGLVARIVSMDSWVWTTVKRGKDGNSIPVIVGPHSHNEFLASNSQPRVSIWSLVPRGIAHDSFSMLLERITIDFLRDDTSRQACDVNLRTQVERNTVQNRIGEFE